MTDICPERVFAAIFPDILDLFPSATPCQLSHHHSKSPQSALVASQLYCIVDVLFPSIKLNPSD